MKQWFASKTKAEIAFCLICVLVGISTCILGFVELDKTPATQADYRRLEEQAYAISGNRDLIFETEGKAEITKGEIKLTLENSECKIITKYNSDFEVMELTRQDKCQPIIAAIVISIVLGICCAGATGMAIIILMLIWVAIRCICECIREKSQKSLS